MRKSCALRVFKIFLLTTCYCLLTVFILGVGSDTDLGDVERAIRDIAIKGYSYSPELLDEQLKNVSNLREQERSRFLPPVLRGFNTSKAQRILVEKFASMKKKIWEDYLAHRLPWQNIHHNNGGSTTGGPLTPPTTIITSASTTTTTVPLPPNIDKYPVLKDDDALKPIVDKINELRSTVKDELNKCQSGCSGDKTSNAPWMAAVNELYKLWDITISDATSMSSKISDAVKNVSQSDKGEFESSMREAIRMKVSGNNYVQMKSTNDQIKEQGFMNDREKECTVQHNIWRAIMGLSPMTAEEKKVIAARKHSEYMAQKNQLGHSEDIPGRETPWARCNAEGTSCQGENAAMGSSDPVYVVKGMWLKSVEHHKNIIGPWVKVGIGFKDPSWWTVVFGP